MDVVLADADQRAAPPRMTLRLPREGEQISHLPAFDFTKLNAVNTCNRWGVIRYGKHLSTNSSGRAMALEAGHACHEVFSACRLFDLLVHGPVVYPGKDIRWIVSRSAVRLFGGERADGFLARATDEAEDHLTRITAAGLYILETSGFYDDPSDQRRTIQRLSDACTAFIHRYSFGKHVPYVSGDDTFVGVETPFEIVAEYDVGGHARSVRFYGRIDGASCYRNDPRSVIIEEYKTASRLNDAWTMSFETSHQVTGYMMAAALLTAQPISRARITGLSIPLPMKYGESIISIMVKRGDLQITEWVRWFIMSTETYMAYIDQPFNAPMMTGQCNRYFRPCAFIPLCAAKDEEERDEMYSMLETEEWSPLDEKAAD